MIGLLWSGLSLAVTLQIRDVVPDGKPVIIGIFSDGSSFPTLSRASRTLTVPASAGSLTVDLGALGPGAWAVAVHHDQNNNGDLDFRWLPPGPAEGTSASCPSRPFAMPSWGSCQFVVTDGQQEVRLQMWY